MGMKHKRTYVFVMIMVGLWGTVLLGPAGVLLAIKLGLPNWCGFTFATVAGMIASVICLALKYEKNINKSNLPDKT